MLICYQNPTIVFAIQQTFSDSPCIVRYRLGMLAGVHGGPFRNGFPAGMGLGPGQAEKIGRQYAISNRGGAVFRAGFFGADP